MPLSTYRLRMRQSRRRRRRPRSRKLSGGRRERLTAKSRRWSRSKSAAVVGAAGLAAYVMYKKNKKQTPGPKRTTDPNPRRIPSPGHSLPGNPDPALAPGLQPPHDLSDTEQDSLPDEILFLIHMTQYDDVISNPLGVNPLHRERLQNPLYLSVVTTDNIDCLRHYLTFPRMLIFSKTLLLRKDYVLNTRDIGEQSHPFAEYQINVNPLVTYFPSQLREFVSAIKADTDRYKARTFQSFRSDFLTFNEVIFANPIGWDGVQCFKDVSIKGHVPNTTAVTEGIKNRYSRKGTSLSQFLVFSSILQNNAENVASLTPCKFTPENSLPIYVSRRLTLGCGLSVSNSCIAMNNIVQGNPSNWSTLINQLNDVRSSIEERTKVEGQMIASGREYRERYGERFLNDEADDESV